MTLTLLITFLLISLALFVRGLQEKKIHIYEPYVPMATMFLGFIGLQLIGLTNKPWLTPPGSLEKTVLMALLCVTSFWYGYKIKVKPLRLFEDGFNRDRLLILSILLSSVGAYFFFLINRLPKEIAEAVQPSGVLVMYLFFANTLTYGFTLACFSFFKYQQKFALLPIGVGTLLFLDRIFIAGKRASTAEFTFTILLSLYFGKGWKLPRTAMVALMVMMVLLMHSTGDYRALSKEHGTTATEILTKIPLVRNVASITNNGGLELKNAAFTIEAYHKTGDYDFGLIHWNALVTNFIPAQLLGNDVKQSLLINLPNVARKTYGYIPVTGTTATGLVDSFGSYWYFGCIKFFLVGILLRKIWNAAILNNLAAQLLYTLLIIKAMHVVSHSTQWFISPWVQMAIFLLPGLLWAQKRYRKVLF